jgi:exodeoxyribonuclease VII large subunit
VDLNTQRKIFSVSEITSEIKQALEKFGIIWVRGEISNFKHHSSGHMYFSLKDAHSQIRAAFFRNNNLYLKFRLNDGLEVHVRGRISVYDPRGEYQIIVEYMEPVGLGSLQLAFDQLKERLRKEGLFDEARKKTLPLLPHKIGIVTSPTGAAIRDMMRILERRNASLHILLFPAKVQGAGSAEEIAAGVRYFNTRQDIDVIIVGRGGGSIEDLWSFNEELVARAIYESQIPVISAVGHEVDYTIADFVADLRAPTPSAAAEMVSGARDELSATVRSLEARLHQAMRLGIERRSTTLERLANNRAFQVAPNMIRDLQQSFDEATLRMNQAMRRYIVALRHRERLVATRLLTIDLRQFIGRSREVMARHHQALRSGMESLLREHRSHFELAAGRLDALSPLAILQRGYSICRNEKGTIIKDAAAVVPGAAVSVRLASGSLYCSVNSIETDSGGQETGARGPGDMS